MGKQSPKQLRNVPCYLGQAPDPCSIPSDSGESEAELECSFADARFSASRTDPGPHLTVTMPHEPGKSGVKAPISLSLSFFSGNWHFLLGLVAIVVWQASLDLSIVSPPLP